jgi:4-diphosphocytidyl-2-C-methyl-D-erythritol kinase
MLTEIARAKLNLALHVRARRPDGYHELETLFAFVEHGDVLRVAPADAPDFRVTGPFAAALAGEGDNLVTRAAARFVEAFGAGAHTIELEKHLPVASGIGGGSADAAATLRALARLHDVPLDAPRLFAIADALGSDVPACLLGQTAIGKGRGEQLEPVAGMPGTPVLLVNPGVAVSTAEVFRRWDGEDRGPLGADPLAGRNDLEAPARAIAPVIGEVLEALASQDGVTLARMSGSGATCFALFESEDACARATASVSRPGWWSVETRLL